MTTARENRELTQVGRGTLMGNMMRRYWLPALLASELPVAGGAPVRVRLLGENLVAFRTREGGLGLIAEACPHRRASLFLGRVEDHGIRCLYHGWKYSPDGRCLDTANIPDNPRFKETIRIPAYPCREIGDVIWAYLGDPDDIPPLPRFEWMLVPPEHRYITKRLQYSNYLQAIEGNLDASHVASLHSDFTFWYPKVPGAQAGPPTVLVAGPPKFHCEPTDYGVITGACRRKPDGTDVWRINHIVFPIYQHVAPEPSIDPNYMIQAATPVDDENTMIFTIDYNADRPLNSAELDYYRSGGGIQPEMIPGTVMAVQNRDNNYLMDRDLQRLDPRMTGIRGVGVQDAAVQESMGAIVAREEEHLCSADVAVVLARRRFLEAAHLLRDQRTEPPGVDPDGHRVRATNITLPADGDWVVASKRKTRADSIYYAATPSLAQATS